LRRQRFDDPTVRDRPTAALINHAVEFTAQRLQVGDLSVNLGPVLFGDGIYGVARAVPLVGEIEQCANLVERKPEVP
jgi:hypothetical protein